MYRKQATKNKLQIDEEVKTKDSWFRLMTNSTSPQHPPSYYANMILRQLGLLYKVPRELLRGTCYDSRKKDNNKKYGYVSMTGLLFSQVRQHYKENLAVSTTLQDGLVNDNSLSSV